MNYQNDSENGDFIKRNAAHFASILGTLSDYSVNNRYNDLEKQLMDYKKRYDEYNKYKKIRQSVTDTQLDDEELKYLTQQQGVDFSPDLMKTEAYQKFNETNPSQVSKITGKPFRSDQDSRKFVDFLKASYSTNGEINPDYAGFVKSKEKNLSDEDLMNAYLLKSDISPEDRKLFDTYRNFDADAYNKKVQNDVLKVLPTLKSRGSLGDTLSDAYAKRGANYLLEEKKDKRTNQFHDGKMFTFDEDGYLISEKQTKDEKVKDFALNKDASIKMFQDKEGNTHYGYFQPDPNSADAGYTGWKYTGVTAEQRDYDYQEGLGEFSNTSGTGKSRTRSRGVSNRGDSGDESGSQLELDTIDKMKKFAKIKAELEANGWNPKNIDPKGKDKYDTNEQKYTDMKKELEALLPDQDVDALANDIYKKTYTGKKSKAKNEVEYLRETIYANPKARVKLFFNNVLKDWGRSDLTAAEWAYEILQDEWSDEEWNLVKSNFTAMTGENIEDHMEKTNNKRKAK